MVSELVIFAALLILVETAITPIYQPLGNMAFWLGILLLITGIIIMVLDSR